MASKIKALQMWCKKMTDGYPHVDVVNFTTSWRDGMAFCALIHRFRPDLIDFDSLSPDNVFDNCKMAFELAEKELNIPAFLEASDMVRLKVPDKLSIITYVSQYYNYLHASPQLGGPGVKSKVSNKSITGTKRPPEIDVSQAPTSKKSTTDVAKENSAPVADKTPQEPLINRCAICQKQVFLLERHMDSGRLYHRSCFRHSELSPTNKVYSRSPFLSPSLNSETPVSHKQPTADIRSGHGDGNMEESKKDTPSAHSSKLQVDKPSNVVKKLEGPGLKHSLAEPDREDSKKSKFQSSDSATAKAALKERLEGLKSKYTEKEKTSGHNLPLSGKEANKLEKRKAEIISSEKSAEAATKGSKRSMPLIFQKKEEAKPSAGSVQSASAQSSDAFIGSSTHVGGFSAGNKNQFLKSTAKDSNTVGELKNTNITKKVDNVNHEESKNIANPTAKPRTLTSTVNHELSPKKPVPTESHHTKDLTPKPAPRRLFTESSEKKQAPERPKDLAVIPELSKAKTKQETPESSSPPPLPSTLPPSTTKYTPSFHVEPSSVDHSSQNHSKLTTSVKANSPTKETFKEMSSSRVLHKDNHKNSEKRWSTPSNLSSAAVLVTPVEKKDEDQVKSGLLSSLAMVRNRTMSTPGSTGQNISVLPSPSPAASNQPDKKLASAVLTKPDQISSNSTVVSKTKWDNSRLGNESNKLADNREKPSDHSTFSVPDGTPRKEASAVPTKSHNIPEAVHTKSILKHVDISSQHSTVNDKTKTSTPSLVGILKGTAKKSTDSEVKDAASHKGGSMSLTKDSNHSKSQPTDSKANERKLSNTQADTKIVNIDSVKSDRKASTDGPVDASKTKKSFLGIFKKDKESSNVNTSSAKLESNKTGILDSHVQNIGHTPVSRDVPDNKKKEESLKKMREEVAKVELSTIRTKNPPSKSGHAERPKSVSIIDIEKENELSVRHKSLENLDKIKENDFEQVLEAKAKLSKPKPKPEPEKAGQHKLDWQVEAEKRMAALASMEKHSSKQDPGGPTKVDANISHVSNVNRNEESMKTSQVVVTKADTKEPEFIVGRSRLKSVDGISNLQVSSTEVASNVTDKKPEEAKAKEDFREKLKALKHVDIDKSEMSVIESNLGVSKDSKKDAVVDGAKLKFDVSLHGNNNNSNVTSTAKVTDLEHITHLNKSHTIISSNGSSGISKTVDNGEVSFSTSNGGVAKLKIDINNTKLISKHVEEKPKTDTEKSQGQSTESDLAGKISPKVKRKITVVGRNKQGVVDSPPSTPHLKKIEVGTKFDFDESLRSTLSESTSRLSISDSRTPPPRPPPPEKVKSPGHMSVIELQQQLLAIDSKLTELEIRGRDLESSIRKVNTSDDNDDDDLMIEWFSLVQEKNELVRKEADLVYISREQELENEQEQIESQLRYLLNLPDHKKSPVEKKEEEYLITKKIQLVEQRNLIVDSIDEDRLRYEEEDRNIKNVLESRGLLKDETGMVRALKGKKVARSIFYT